MQRELFLCSFETWDALKIYCWGLNVFRLLFSGSNQNIEYTWLWFLPCSSGVWIYKTQHETPCFGDSPVQIYHIYDTWLCSTCLIALNILKKTSRSRAMFCFSLSLDSGSKICVLEPSSSPLLSSVGYLAPRFLMRLLSVQFFSTMLQYCGCFSLGPRSPDSRRLMFCSLLISFGSALSKCREWQMMFCLSCLSKVWVARVDGCAFCSILGTLEMNVSSCSLSLSKSARDRVMF